MQYNALIIDRRLAGLTLRRQDIKSLVCSMDDGDSLNRMYQAADRMDERPCLCLVVTECPEAATLARAGGFETATVGELAAINF